MTMRWIESKRGFSYLPYSISNRGGALAQSPPLWHWLKWCLHWPRPGRSKPMLRPSCASGQSSRNDPTEAQRGQPGPSLSGPTGPPPRHPDRSRRDRQSERELHGKQPGRDRPDHPKTNPSDGGLEQAQPPVRPSRSRRARFRSMFPESGSGPQPDRDRRRRNGREPRTDSRRIGRSDPPPPRRGPSYLSISYSGRWFSHPPGDGPRFPFRTPAAPQRPHRRLYSVADRIRKT